MPEPLTSQLLLGELQKLLVAFPRNLGARDPGMMADVYRNGLRGLSGDAVRFAVDRSISDDQYFPKVARLRELATEWSKRTNAVISIQKNEEWGVCSVCGARAIWPEITRIKKDPTKKYAPIRDEKGEIMTETVQSDRSVIVHDRRRHGIFDREVGDVS